MYLQYYNFKSKICKTFFSIYKTPSGRGWMESPDWRLLRRLRYYLFEPIRRCWPKCQRPMQCRFCPHRPTQTQKSHSVSQIVRRRFTKRNRHSQGVWQGGQDHLQGQIWWWGIGNGDQGLWSRVLIEKDGFSFRWGFFSYCTGF